MARPSMKTEHVKSLEGEDEEKHRLEVILKTVSGELSITEACEMLGVKEARFHALRKQALQGALNGIAPRAAGRPPILTPEESSRIKELEAENKALKFNLYAERVRTEIAVTFPHMVKESKKKMPYRHPPRLLTKNDTGNGTSSA